MTIEQMKARKTELGLTNEMIAEKSGVPLSTVQKIFSGATKAPRRLTLHAIAKVLEASGSRTLYSNQTLSGAGAVREAAVSCQIVSKDDRHTIEDYYALPEDQRVELIDGVFYDMSAPSVTHQIILGELHILFRKCADRHSMPCIILLSPCDVRLDQDDYTMVQPDLIVLCRKPGPDANRVEGAPDLLVEILSPSTRMKDMILKLHKYQSAGVREYWIVDPKHLRITVHDFESEEYDPKTYDFRSEIPVSISGGTCSIDFSVVMDRLRALNGWE